MFGTGVFVFQQYREANYRKQALENILKSYAGIIQRGGVTDALPSNLRVTIVKGDGQVIFDNEVEDLNSMDNHLQRPEIESALSKGEGVTIRHSQSKKQDFFYYAVRYGDNYLRVALPFDLELKSQLSNDNVFLLFFLLFFVAALIFVLVISDRFGNNISQLHRFATATDKGENIELNFIDNELGDISRQIAHNYNLLIESEARLAQEHQKLLESTETSRRMKHEMTGNIAHELKTPVAAVRGYIETLLSQKVPLERQQQFLLRCHDQIIRLSHLIDDISLITKIEEAPTLFAKESVNLLDTLNEVLYDLQEEITSAGDSVEDNLPDTLFVNGSRTLIYSIFRNLVENTLKYAGRGVTISVDLLAGSEEYYTISYRDNGAGISSEHFPRLFERFYRVDYGRSREGGGSGLGLSIVRNAVAIHRGEISVSTPPQGGVEFIFTLAVK
ncbi:Phosphate regulon sensor protein PhoR (SphS) [Mucinivorans hirudinis]|uniref:histidine kinase n=1 Tax=Mucinivorans hirudinis TaxID=1433126 RepID=A0A060R9N3_9BACT|nr:Phosphate regulon sensor protein PhoR (SphS) [Mucinivorans hirudinis]